MDICVRCGACADKCHFFIGSGDPKNMPVLRAELLRSIYRQDFTTAGKILGSLAGGRELTEEVLKEWYYYFFQCTECRRCSVYCPYGIDTAEITMMARELMNLVGLNINWILEPVANCQRTGNHLGIQPHTYKDNVEFLCEELEDDDRESSSIRRSTARGGGSLRHPVGRLLRRPRDLHLCRLSDALQVSRTRLHAEFVRLGRRQLRPLQLRRKP